MFNTHSPSNNKKTLIGTFIVLILFSLIIGWIILDTTHGQPTKINSNEDNLTIDELLKESVDDVNKTCPKKINSVTELINITIPLSHTYQMNFKVDTVFTKEGAIKFQKAVEKDALEGFKTNKAFKIFNDSAVIIMYTMVDKNDSLLFKTVYTPDMYKAQ